MKITHYIFVIGAALGLLAACNTDDVASYTPVDAAHDGIVLRAGVSEGSMGIATRAIDDRHGKHGLFKSGTKLTLQLNGYWSSSLVTKDAEATTGGAAAGTDEKHNSIVLSPSLYWNDYGVADPANTGGRAAGLTIYGVAVDGLTTQREITDWGALSWDLDVDQTGGWADRDLLTSNNIRPTGADPDGTGRTGDGTYKFDDFMQTPGESTTPSDIIEFTHAMAKLTVVLTAGQGFPDGKFATAPTATLSSFKYIGSVSIPGKTSTPNNDLTGNIKMHLASGGAASTATFDALVYPGNSFADNTEILTFTADGNTFGITATKLNAAIDAAIASAATNGYPTTTAGDHALKQGWNYKLQITVDKTGTQVTATIVDWNDVTAESETPKINIDYAYGHVPGTDFAKGFDLYRSTTVTGSYLGTGDHAVVSFADSKYTMTPQLYWPNHSTHYFFRGVWPLVGTAEGPAAAKVKAGAIDVQNVAYKQGYYPSDLMIGRPLNSAETAADEDCKVHSGTKGICATEGDIRMNFRYVMSQVEVELKSATGAAAVNIGADTKVELVNVYNAGSANFSDGSVVTTGELGNFTLNPVAGANLKRHSAIVPQSLTYTTPGAAANLRFKITVTNTDGTTDVYFADVNPIQKQGTTTKVAPNGKWESGTHYKYVLTLSKTGVSVTATLTDWVEVTADVPVWF